MYRKIQSTEYALQNTLFIAITGLPDEFYFHKISSRSLSRRSRATVTRE